MGQQVASALKDSMHRVLVKLVSFLPGLLALLVAVIVLTLIGALLALILRRILTAAKFDERFARNQASNVTDWSPGHSPTTLIARTAFWACFVLGCIIGLSAFDASYAGNSQISSILIAYLTHSVGAVLILIAGSVIARFLARSVLIGAVNLQMQHARFLSLGVKWLILVLTAAMVLDHLEIGGVVVELAFGILFGGIVLTLALAIGLGSRDLVSRSLEQKVDKPDHTRDPESETAFDETIPTVRPRPTGTLRHF
jgi:hypothetical protein